MSRSSHVAEIITAESADDIGYFLKEVLQELFPLKPIKHELLLDSKSIFETITSLHRSVDYLLRKVMANMRDSFELGELNAVRYIPSNLNYADA